MSQAAIALDGESLITPESIRAGYSVASLVGVDDRLAVAEVQLALTLNIGEQRFRKGEDAFRVTAFLFHEMHKMRARLDPSVWRELVPMAQNHPIAALLHEDPFTRWSFDKPRGYSGDARLLDFIYRHESVEPLVAQASPLGRAIHAYTVAAPAAEAVRERRRLLARLVDETAAARGPGAEILTIASGHLREALLSTAFAEGRIGRWVALDQDPMSVGATARDFAGTAVEAIDGSVRGILKGEHALGTFDFAYAAGLYDYLPHEVAVRLTDACLKLLKPGGAFLFANFNQDIVDDGYMETFMNWPLLLRSERQIWDIVRDVSAAGRIEADVFRGANGNILYAMLRLTA